ncbi:MAG: GxxExxY protein [Wenzhouxiangella sp.]|nr:MAG: GxxExxY protein [Wenzhouxiangella sp.]
MEPTDKILPALRHEEITASIRQTAFEVHRYFGNGFLEKIYEGALENRLRKLGHEVGRQVPLEVADEDGTLVGHYNVDLLVDGKVLLEIKAVRQLIPEHQAQILNYLKATGIRVGMLINFGTEKVQIKRFTV